MTPSVWWRKPLWRTSDHLNGVCPTIHAVQFWTWERLFPSFSDTHLTQVQHHNGLDVTVYWKPMHTHWPVPGFLLTPPYPCEEGSCEVSVQQSQRHHHALPPRATCKLNGSTCQESSNRIGIPVLLHPVNCQSPSLRSHWWGGQPADSMHPLCGWHEWRDQIHQGYYFRVVFSHKLSSLVTRVKDTLPQSWVVYRIPCNCGKVYIGETVRTRMKGTRKQAGTTAMSAIAEHIHGLAPTLHQMGGDHHCGLSQRTLRASTEKGHPHPLSFSPRNMSTTMREQNFWYAGLQPWQHGNKGVLVTQWGERLTLKSVWNFALVSYALSKATYTASSQNVGNNFQQSVTKNFPLQQDWQ